MVVLVASSRCRRALVAGMFLMEFFTHEQRHIGVVNWRAIRRQWLSRHPVPLIRDRRGARRGSCCLRRRELVWPAVQQLARVGTETSWVRGRNFQA